MDGGGGRFSCKGTYTKVFRWFITKYKENELYRYPKLFILVSPSQRHFSHMTKSRIFKNLNLRKKADRKFRENSKVKSPFQRFWIRPVMSRYMCEFMDDILINLKKHVLDPVWLLDDQELIPTFFSEDKNSFWRSRKSGNVETWKRLRQCPNVTYIFMFAWTVPEPEFNYCGFPVAYGGNV